MSKWRKPSFILGVATLVGSVFATLIFDLVTVNAASSSISGSVKISTRNEASLAMRVKNSDAKAKLEANNHFTTYSDITIYTDAKSGCTLTMHADVRLTYI